ncbi:hypothetical protein [Paenibacillus bouchesdurhonensis]|uniref:hypothetical protein n=1 Tax=Paenibacillus bouchesdurhonensis TaxID=1870990 RepID=UPI000DA5F641|nr:hypothetical protein [Paenibacillus bouchesdurhonensis]
MVDNLEKTIFVAAEIFLFIVAFIFALNGIHAQEAAFEAARKSMEQEERRLYTSLQLNSNETYTGAEVIQSLYQIPQLGVNIQVGGQYFSKYNDPETINISGIDPYKVYDVAYIRDSQGILLTIIFT